MENFKIDVDGDTTTVLVDCDLDNEGVASRLIDCVSQVLKDSPPKVLALEMSQVRLINSYGIGKVLMLKSRLSKLGIEFIVKNPSKFVAETFSMLLLDDILRIER